MKVVFMGTMNFAVPVLQGLSELYQVSLVVTQPDRPFGRKKVLKPTPVKEKAMELGIPLFQPESIRKEYQRVLDEEADVIIVAAYGQMIPSIILTTPKYRCINVHASLLPKLRGGAPMHKAIQRGFKETGVTIMYMADKMDSGEILSQEALPILDSDDVGTLEEKLAILGRDLLLKTLPSVIEGTIQATPQDLSEVTFAYNIKHEEEHLDFTQSAREIYNHVRGYHPSPLTYFLIDDILVKVYKTAIVDEISRVDSIPGEIVEVTKKTVVVNTGQGRIALLRIGVSGKNVMDTAAFLSGDKQNLFQVGKVLK
ncbi:MAG: methionyl-tRNA formyltransferase [Candidatus Izemoplasmatales bacterium]